jgi:8-oxo-dGTP pyrophosphatase MutT (NUDIX family)
VSDIPKPSGTVVVVRDGVAGLEVLLLERSSRREDRTGPSVFPGGKVDDVDRVGGEDVVATALRASVREAEEEAGLQLDARSLVPISRWITPKISPKRFDTWFFVAGVTPDAEIQVDGREICKHRWLGPAAALDAHRGGEISLAPPTFVTVTWLTRYAEVSATLDGLAGEEVVTFRPRICRLPDGACMLYPGDAGYEESDPAREGSRHRLWALADGYRYERT